MPASALNAKLRSITTKKKPCDVPQCPNRRVYVGRYCAFHQLRNRAYGNPFGRSISKEEVAPYLKIVRRTLKQLQANASVVAAMDTLRPLLDPGAEPTMPKPLRLNARWLLHRELRRIEDEGAKVEEALAATAAVWMFALRNPRELPDDIRLTYALGRAVLKLRRLACSRVYWNDELQREEKTYRAVPGLASRLLGQRVRRQLGVFFLNLVAHIDQQHEAALVRAAILRQPITA